jgi:hypothetical protein
VCPTVLTFKGLPAAPPPPPFHKAHLSALQYTVPKNPPIIEPFPKFLETPLIEPNRRNQKTIFNELHQGHTDQIIKFAGFFVTVLQSSWKLNVLPPLPPPCRMLFFFFKYLTCFSVASITEVTAFNWRGLSHPFPINEKNHSITMCKIRSRIAYSNIIMIRVLVSASALLPRQKLLDNLIRRRRHIVVIEWYPKTSVHGVESDQMVRASWRPLLGWKTTFHFFFLMYSKCVY